MAEPTPINRFEEACCEAVRLLRRVADHLEAADTAGDAGVVGVGAA